MSLTTKKRQTLIRKYLENNLSEQEATTLENWKESSAENRQTFSIECDVARADVAYEKANGPRFPFRRAAYSLIIVAICFLVLIVGVSSQKKGNTNEITPTTEVAGERTQQQQEQLSLETQLPPTVTITKGGYISYDHTPIQDVMQAITYFYKIPVIYKGKLPDSTFSGAVNPNLKLEGMIKLLTNNDIKVSYDGEILIVGE